jgi:hypothetical protein
MNDCPECGYANYLVWPSRKDCQTCLRLRLERLDRAFARHAADREVSFQGVNVATVGSDVASHANRFELFDNNSRSSDAK